MPLIYRDCDDTSSTNNDDLLMQVDEEEEEEEKSNMELTDETPQNATNSRTKTEPDKPHSDDTSSTNNDDLLMQVDEEEEEEKKSNMELTDETPQNPTISHTETEPDKPQLLTEKLIYKTRTKEELWLESEEYHTLMHNCEICNQHFTMHVGLIDHITSHASKPKTAIITTPPVVKSRYRCHHCNFTTYEKKLLTYHVARNHLKINTCNFCHGAFDDADDAEIVSHKFLCRLKTLKFKCKRCSHRFRTQEKLEIHTQNCGEHYCYHCNLSFDTWPNLLLHQRKHLRVKMSKCNKCHVTLQSKPALDRHMLRYHSDNQPTFRCDTCGKTDFRTKQLLIKHEWLSHNPASKIYPCKFCSQSFSQPAALKKHRIIHETDKEKAKPFECELCSKRFRIKSTLSGHIRRVHEQIMEAICDVCGKQFRTKFHLKVHMFSHTGEKPFLCKVCGKGFYTTGNLRVHELEIHDIMPWNCQVCGEGFKLKATCDEHLFKEHKVR